MPYKRPKDRFYTLAREQGYRSRAAFKLIQIHKELDIYSGVVRAIDLCAAPGSWLQVLNKECPTLKLGIGLDLEKIKSIPNTATHVCDINTDEADRFIKETLGKSAQKVDLILCDGAANVRGEYFSDAVQQNTLVISSIKICVKFLKPRGVFVTKFYRSEFYDKALDILKKLFIEVKSFKPIASRKESAETYIISKKMRLLRDNEKEKIVKEIEELFKTKENKNLNDLHNKKEDTNDNDEIKLFSKELTKKDIDNMFKRKEENVFEIETKTVYFEDFINRRVDPETLLYLDTLSVKEEDKLEELLNDLKVKSNKNNITEQVTYICKNIQMLNKTEFNFLLKLRKLNTKRIKELNKNISNINKTLDNDSNHNKNDTKKDIQEKLERIEKTKTKMKDKKEKKWNEMMNTGEKQIDMNIEDMKENENNVEFPIQQVNELQSQQKEKIETENTENETVENKDINNNEINNKELNYDKYLKETLENADDFRKAQLLAISRKIMSEEGEQELETKAFNKYCFVQDQKVPSWFVKDELNANDKKNLLTTSEIDAELKLLNRVKQKHINKKEQEAKLRQAARKTKKIKKLNKLLDKDTEYTNKEIKGMISKISKKKERPKQYEVVKGKGPSKTVGKAVEGKSRKVFVDRRMKKDKKREKIKKRRGNKFLGRASRNLKKYKRKRN